MKDLKRLLADHQGSMSEFQHDWLVTVRAGGTVYGQYMQSLRELYSRFNSAKELQIEQERLQLDIEELEKKIRSIKPLRQNEISCRRLKIDLKEKVMRLDGNQRSMAECIREFKRFYQQASWLKEKVGELDKKKRRELDTDLWTFRIKEMAAVDYVVAGRIRNNTFEFLNALPMDLRLQVAEAIKDPDALIRWHETKSEVLVPDELPEIETHVATRLLGIDNGSKTKRLE